MYTIKTLRQHYVLLRRSCVDNMTTGASIYPDEMDKGATSNHMGIGRMLIMWRRSVYKVVYQELIVFLLLFGILSVVYRSVLNDVQKKYFEQSKVFFQSYIDHLSVPFLLGFYVTTVAGRWWQQYLTIPWPDRLMLAIQIYITGDQELIRELRQGLVRRSLLMLVLLLRSISPAVRRRYPTLKSLVLDGVMTRKEKQSFESIVPVVNLFWVPATWFATALQDAVSDGMLTNEYGTKLIMEEFLEFRANCGALWSYNWVSIPMIYTQVCTLSTYSYFIACLVARQYTGPSHQSLQDIDIVLPIGTVMELVCYVGLLKVAEQIKNPFGDSDEDFDLNFLITRHLRTVHLGLDDLDVNCPPLTDASSGQAASNEAGDSLQLMPGQLLQNERHASELIKY
ncbi:bestrophin-2 isoform X1 [Daphnia magna]|uniref:bestrophin-2 isoform X1 n=1 Tax=Daphnia magna TaxID=35525 RepID=UPI001403567D|nr:bestrophin-2 isoform X1 [Daphnia magna]